MHQIHPNARTTPAVRAEIARSSEPSGLLAQRYGVSTETIRKWRKRGTADCLDRSARPHNLPWKATAEERAVVCLLRERTNFALDDLTFVVRHFLPHLNRDSIWSILKAEGLNRRRPAASERPARGTGKFRDYDLGFIYIDIKQLPMLQTADFQRRKRYLFVAIDRFSRSVHLAVKDDMTTNSAVSFLREAAAAFAFRITHVLTDNGICFSPTFEKACAELGAEYRHTRPYTPQTTDKIEQPYLATGAIFLLLTGDRVAKSRARGASPAAQPMIVAPPLRRSWAPVVLACSSLRSGADTLSRPVRPGASPPRGYGSGYSHRLNHADHVVQAGLSAVPDPAASWHAALA
jgi:transposase